MEVNYKYCKRCETKVSLNSTQCLVCNSREFVTQDEVNQAAEALLNYVSAQQGVQRIGLLSRISKWFGAIHPPLTQAVQPNERKVHVKRKLLVALAVVVVVWLAARPFVRVSVVEDFGIVVSTRTQTDAKFSPWLAWEFDR